MEAKKVHKVLLTGGPCGGKTTSINQLKQALSDKHDVYVVSELGEFMAKVGVTFESMSETMPEYTKNFWASQVGMQISREDNLRFFFGKGGRDIILLCDRGIWDCFAFGPDHLRIEYLSESKNSRQLLLEDRYDLVVVMVSSAFGIPEIYGLDNNILRTENLQQAIDLEKRMLDIYSGHPNMFIVDNFVKNIGLKIERVCKGVSRFIAQENPLMTIHKLKIPSKKCMDRIMDRIPSLKRYVVTEKHTFLVPSQEDSHAKLVKRSFNDGHEVMEVHWLVIKPNTSGRNRRIKIEGSFYESRLAAQNSAHHCEVRKTITTFIDLRESGVHNIWEIHCWATHDGETYILKVKRDFDYPSGTFSLDVDLEECQDAFGKTEFTTEFIARRK